MQVAEDHFKSFSHANIEPLLQRLRCWKINTNHTDTSKPNRVGPNLAGTFGDGYHTIELSFAKAYVGVHQKRGQAGGDPLKAKASSSS